MAQPAFAWGHAQAGVDGFQVAARSATSVSWRCASVWSRWPSVSTTTSLASPRIVSPCTSRELGVGHFALLRGLTLSVVAGDPGLAQLPCQDCAMNPEDRFAEIVAEMADIPGVTPPGAGSGFGSSTLRFDKKIIAMLADDRLVVKLPKARVDALVDAGEGVRFDGNKGKPMKEWFSLDPGSQLEWRSLTDEALNFVRRRADG
jgi:hypothetical protein